jgi:nucleotide-binding universal stress UspA family protein
MRFFRRQQTGELRPPVRAAVTPARRKTIGLPLREDSGSILVAVDGRPKGWGMLEWAAAEAAARGSVLRIMHAYTWSTFPIDAFGGLMMMHRDPQAELAAELIVAEAARRARRIAPTLRISTHLQGGSPADAVLREGRWDSLIVLGRRSRAHWINPYSESPGLRVARRAACPVAIIDLLGHRVRGPASGRVVVCLSGAGDPRPALGLAFRAALRRGAGVTVLAKPGGHVLKEALRMCQDAFPEVPFHRVSPLALARESTGAALTVLDARPHGRLHRAFAPSSGDGLLRSRRGPIVVAGTTVDVTGAW